VVHQQFLEIILVSNVFECFCLFRHMSFFSKGEKFLSRTAIVIGYAVQPV